ncbi:MAG TPA: Ig-like domain repeat protein, partial [Thermoanaerobaculia bacterium]|nr:Ig-like domain repeat protein [Thermoanaerobaculia bacterium]
RVDDGTLIFLEPASQPTGTLQSTLTVTPVLNPGPARKWLYVDATVSGPSGLLPGGWVHFMLGTLDIGIHAVDKEGKVRVSGNYPIGDYTITADYLGDDHLVPASASFVQSVVPTPTITKVSAYQTKLQIGQSVLLHGETIHATGGYYPTGNVTLKKGSTVIGTVKNFPNSATYLSINDPAIFPIGTHTVTAEWAGDANYLASVSQPLTITITKVIPQMTVTRPAGTVFVGQTATFSAAFPNRADVTGTVAFTLGGTLLGSAAVSGGAASITVPVSRYGLSLPLVAEYSGSDQYDPNSASTTLDVYGGDFSGGPPSVKSVLTPATSGGGFDVTLSITPLIGATSYDVYRSTGAGGFTPWRTYFSYSPWSWYGDTLPAGEARIYQVIARDAAGHSTLGSAPAIALGMTFADDPLLGGATLIKATHLGELRAGINAVRRAAGLPVATFSTIAAGSLIRASDLAEVRQALTQARTAVGLTTPLTDPSLAAAMTVRAAHVQELRDAMR